MTKLEETVRHTTGSAKAELPNNAFIERELQRIQDAIDKGNCQKGIGSEFANELRELINDPSKINQGISSDCVSAAAMYALAKRDPAELARICSDLAIKGHTVVNGARITLTLKPEQVDPTGNFAARDQVESIFQESITKSFTVSRTFKDQNGQTQTESGVTIAKSSEMFSTIFGQSYIGIGSESDKAKVFSSLLNNADAIAKSPPLFATLNWLPGSKDSIHQVTVLGVVEKKDSDGTIRQYVRIYQGWGANTSDVAAVDRVAENADATELIPVDVFNQRLIAYQAATNSTFAKGLKDTTSEIKIPDVTPQTFIVGNYESWMKGIQSLLDFDQAMKSQSEKLRKEIYKQ
jgi:hypothetical protein